MKTKISLIFLALISVFVSACYAEYEDSITITTYYPAPAGSYNELRTYNNTYLATDGGNVGVGKTNPAVKLDVNGDLLINRNIGMNTTNVTLTAPNLNTTGNLNTNDIWLRSVNQWASQSVAVPNSANTTCIRMGNMQQCWGRRAIAAGVTTECVTVTFPQSFKSGTIPTVTATYYGNSGAQVRCIDATDHLKTNVCYTSNYAASYYIEWIAIGVWQ